MRRIVPAILSDDLDAMKKMVKEAESFCSWMQYDIMDKIFVPSESVKVKDAVKTAPACGWEAHLMTVHPEKHFRALAKAGCRRIIIHVEAVDDAPKLLKKIKALGCEAGLAINPDTPLSVLTPEILAEMDYILFMSVYPGYYGRPFVPEVLDKMREFKTQGHDIIIGIDGGVKLANVKEVADAGAEEICVGSAAFAQADTAAAFKTLTATAMSSWNAK